MAWKKIPPAHKPIFYAALPEQDRVSTINMFGGTVMMVNGAREDLDLAGAPL